MKRALTHTPLKLLNTQWTTGWCVLRCQLQKKKRREEHVMFPLFTTNCPVSGGYRHKPGYSQQLQPIFPPVWWPDEFGCDLYCLPREHKEQIALSLATVYLVLSYLYQFP